MLIIFNSENVSELFTQIVAKIHPKHTSVRIVYLIIRTINKCPTEHGVTSRTSDQNKEFCIIVLTAREIYGSVFVSRLMIARGIRLAHFCFEKQFRFFSNNNFQVVFLLLLFALSRWYPTIGSN